MTVSIIPVFVYGTLKAGGALHRHLDGGTFLGARELSGFIMFDMGPFPALVRVPDCASCRVRGELWLVTRPRLDVLDWVEGVPNHYRRIVTETTESEPCYVYVYPTVPIDRPILEDGCWSVARSMPRTVPSRVVLPDPSRSE